MPTGYENQEEEDPRVFEGTVLFEAESANGATWILRTPPETVFHNTTSEGTFKETEVGFSCVQPFFNALVKQA
jgi:hypothetical protein